MELCLLAQASFNGALSASPHSLMGLDTRSILLAKINEPSHSTVVLMGLLSARSVLMGLCLLRLFHGALSATQGFNGALSASPHPLLGL